MVKISVIICTYNPRHDHLERVLEGLKAQTLPGEQWELLIIDNGSKEILSEKWDLSWHPHAKHLREEKAGKTNALITGINVSQGDLIVIVDQDNILQDDYLSECLEIAVQFPFLGAWGGQWIPEFEFGPPDEKWKEQPYTLTVTRNVWSNNYDLDTTPFGAGACFRSKVARQYATLAINDPLRLALDRKGADLGQNGDVDMAFVACDMGMGLGRFTSLALIHLIPGDRLDESYLVRLSEGAGYSEVLMHAIRGIKSYHPRLIDRVANSIKRRFLTPTERRMIAAREKGQRRAIEELITLDKSK